jgi:hypothetical protein
MLEIHILNALNQPATNWGCRVEAGIRGKRHWCFLYSGINTEEAIKGEATLNPKLRKGQQP